MDQGIFKNIDYGLQALLVNTHANARGDYDRLTLLEDQDGVGLDGTRSPGSIRASLACWYLPDRQWPRRPRNAVVPHRAVLIVCKSAAALPLHPLPPRHPNAVGGPF